MAGGELVGPRWKAFNCWLDFMSWAKVNLFLAAATFIGNTVALWTASASASLSTLFFDKAMVVHLETFLWIYAAASTWGGLNGALFTVGKRATANPAYVRAEAEADVMRSTGQFPAVSSAPAAVTVPAPNTASTATDGRSGPNIEPARNLDDEGRPL